MSDFTNFRALYDELTDEVSRSRLAFLPDHLRNWFKHLDETTRVFAIVERLETGCDFDGFLDVAKQNKKLDWGSAPERSLGLRLSLLREIAMGRENAGILGYHFFGRRSDVDANARELVQQIFEPMARELRRYLEKEAQPQAADVEEAQNVPAADRNVSLDHNSKSYQDIDEGMEELEKAIREANDFADPLEKEQREAEVSAARHLMKAARIRLEPLASLLKPILLQFTTKVKDHLIATAAALAAAALIAYFGPIFKALLGL